MFSDVQGQLLGFGIDGDFVTILDDRQRAALFCLGAELKAVPATGTAAPAEFRQNKAQQYAE